jgi:hypothetical protein
LFLCAPAFAIQPDQPLTVTSVTGGELGVLNDTDSTVNIVYADLTGTFDVDSLPDDFRGAYMIRTNDSDKDSNSTDVVQFTTNREALICVWHSPDETDPGWIATDGYSDYNVSLPVTDFLGQLDANCAVKAAGTHAFDGNTVSGTATGPNYIITIQPSSHQAFDKSVPAAAAGEVRFLTTSGTLAEGSNGNFGILERINGSSGAATAVIQDAGTGTCSAAAPDEYDVTGDTASWADGVSGSDGANFATVTTSGKADISADCTVVLNIGSVTTVTKATSNQTYTVTVQAAVTPGAGIYVDADTDPSGDGTSGNPYDNLDDAVAVATPGDTIYCQGRFADHDGDDNVVDVARSESGTAGNKITITQWPAQTTCTIGNINHDTKVAAAKNGLIFFGAEYYTIDGIAFETTWDACVAFEDDGSGNGSAFIDIINSTLTECAYVDHACTDSNGRVGIGADARSHDLLIDSNVIDTAGRATANLTDCPTQGDAYRHDHGIYAKGKYWTITNNTFINMLAGYGIKVDGFDQSLGNLASGEYSHIIMNNTFGPHTNVNPNSNESGSPVRPFNSTSNSFNPRWHFANNLILDLTHGEAAITISDGTNSNFPGNTCEHNIVQDSSGFQSVCDTHETYVDAGDVAASDNVSGQTAAQLDLTDAANKDYTLGASSTAIEAADCTLTGAPSDDQEGDTRSATTCDAGMDEYVP